MATDPDFLNQIKDLFCDLGPIRTGSLFGGTALYLDEAMFAVVFGDALYMKSDADLAKTYADAGSQPFTYDTKTGIRTINGLMSLPDSALDDPDEALSWARLSLVPATAAADKKRAEKAKKRLKSNS
jgi:DNA transformation protein